MQPPTPAASPGRADLTARGMAKTGYFTVTTNVAVAVFGPPQFGRPRPPLIVHCTFVTPVAKCEPEAGLHAPGLAPGNALGSFQVATAPDGDDAGTVLSVGTSIVPVKSEDVDLRTVQVGCAAAWHHRR